MIRKFSLYFALLGILAGSAHAANNGNSAKEPKPKLACNALEGKTIPASAIGLPTGGATISSAKIDKGWGTPGSPDYVPEFCDIRGQIAPATATGLPINFAVNIPTAWNRKSFQIGGNGTDGFVPLLSAFARDRAGSPQGPAYPPDAPFPIAQGYATYGSDAGHQGSPGPWTFAGRGGPNAPALPPNAEPAPQAAAGGGRGGGNAWIGNDEAFTNYGYAQIKKTHDVAMQIIILMYGVTSRVNYFAGESQGGREALMAAARFPRDYDGIVSSVSLAYLTGLQLTGGMRMKAQMAPGAWVPPAKGEAIAKEILRLCDSLDGLEDGVINNYYACNQKLDPTVTPDPLAHIRCAGGADTGNDCLSDTQMAVVNSIHAPMPWGFELNGESSWPGWSTGAEGPMGWLLAATQPDPNRPAAGGLLVARYNNPAYDTSKMSFAELKEQIEGVANIQDVPADWTPFFGGHTKLIMYTAASDYVSNPRAQMHLYETLAKRFGQGKVDHSIRYYVAPNVSHGSVGKSATTGKRLPQYVDLLSVLEAWVEHGKTPPDVLVQTVKANQAPYTVERSKVLCRYPSYPRYLGTGDADKAESYGCATP
jgi:Tannase and feruloyl esterase